MTVWSRIAASVVKLPPPRTTEVSVERGLTAKMPDGVELVADRWYPTHPLGEGKGEPATVLIRTPYGRTVMGPLGRLYAERGYQVVVQSCRGTFGSGGEFVPVRNEQADGRATLEWVAGQPWFDGRLVMWGGSYLGMTQWAVAQDAPDFVRALSLQVTAANFRDSVVFPGGAFALETGLAWLHEIKNQELGWRTVLRTHLRGARVVSTASAVLPLGKCDAAAIGEPMAFYQDWLEHSAPGDPWWDAVDFGRRLEKVPPSSFIGGWYDLFLKAQVDDYEALRRAGRTARLTIGPWTHASPGLFAETVRDGPRWFDSQLGPDPGGAPGRAGAPLRHGVAHLEGVLAVAAGGGDRAVVSRTGRDADPHTAGRRRRRQRQRQRQRHRQRQRPRPVPLQPARPHAGRGRTVAQHGHGGAQGPASPRGPARRADLHQPRAHRGPHRHRPADARLSTCARHSSTPTSSCACAT